MSKKIKILLYSLIGVFVLLQFYPSNQPEVSEVNSNDLLKNTDAPDNVAYLLRTACYDCHSNETTYPWYANIAPVKWWIYDHINEGREDLNFSVWNILSKADQAEALDDIATAVMEGEMPLKSYPITHPKAKLSEAERQAISDWTEILAEKLFE